MAGTKENEIHPPRVVDTKVNGAYINAPALEHLDFDPKSVLDLLAQGIRVISKDFVVLYINRSFSELSGVSCEDARGKKCWELFKSPFCHSEDCRLNKILGGSDYVQTEMERRKPDGTMVPCLVTAFPLRQENDTLIGIMESFRDISEKQELLSKFRESEERYRALIELGSEVGEAILMLQDTPTVEGAQVYFSDQWLKLTGYDREEIFGQSFMDIISAEERQDILTRYRQRINGRIMPGLFEITIIRKDQTPVPVEYTAAISMYQGKPSVVVYVRDLSERKKLERERHEFEERARQLTKQSEERYRSLFEDVPVAIYELDYSDVKQRIDELRDSGVSDFKRFFKDNWDEFLYCFSLRKVIGLNNAVVKMLGAESKEYVAEHIQELLEHRPTGLKQDLLNLLALIQGQNREISQLHQKNFKGSWQYLSARFTLAPGHQQDWARVFLSFWDITERVNAEKELKKYQERLEEIVSERTSQLSSEVENRKAAEAGLNNLYLREIKLRQELEKQINRRIEFTRTLVHELKTPLSPMLGSSELLVKGIADEELLRIARNVHRGALDLNDRVSDLIDLNQGEMGIITLVPKLTDVEKEIREIVDYVTPMVERKEQRLVIDIPGKLTETWLDATRLRQIILNLLENAFIHTPRGGCITLGAVCTKQVLLIEISDTGCGIAKSHLKRIFDPYPSKHIRENVDGLGIGLPLCKMLVELHGGTISVKSEKGEGSTFSFSIPINRKYSKRQKAK